MDMSSNSQLVIFDRLFVMVAEFERSYIELNFLHVTIKAGEGGGQPFRDLSLLFMSLFQGGGEGAGQLWTMSLILQFFFFEVVPYINHVMSVSFLMMYITQVRHSENVSLNLC